MNTRRGYDRIVFAYDFFAGVFSFGQINKSQLAFVSTLSDASTCLILGGGTGYFLQKLVEGNKTIRVTYVDASEKMVTAAQKRIQTEMPEALNRITFVCKDVNDFEWQPYDVIVCNYFLDLFDDVQVEELAVQFKKHLSIKALLYITDFNIPQTNRFFAWTAKIGLKFLYSIHRSLTKIETHKLPAIEKSMMKQNLSVVYSKEYLRGILLCRVYRVEQTNNGVVV